MEDILIEKIKEKMKDRKFKADAFIREVNSEYGKKLLKMFVDTKAVNCDFRVMSGSEYSEFFCELVSTPQRIILRPDLHDEKKISIQIFDAYRDLRISDLNRLGYHMMPTDMETIKKYGMLDFVKVVNVEDLERELLAYLKRLESSMREKSERYARSRNEVDMFIEYLEDETGVSD